jgi:type I restriction enzyme, R subunit
LLSSLRDLLATMPTWTRNVQTQAEVEVFIRDFIWAELPRPPFSDEEAEILAKRIYDHVWQQSLRGTATFAV